MMLCALESARFGIIRNIRSPQWRFGVEGGGEDDDGVKQIDAALRL